MIVGTNLGSQTLVIYGIRVMAKLGDVIYQTKPKK